MRLEPNKIFDFVIDKVEAMKSHAQSISDDSVGASSDEDASGESKERQKQLTQAKELLQRFESIAIKSAEDYKSVAEFDTFTIAFYGETNAGKSTIIEALRIYFGEGSKQNERAKFDKFCKQYKWYNEGFWGKILAYFNPSLKSNALNNLLGSSDGAIIGDGRKDFTRQNHTYHFSHNGVEFDILDVPGIEGDEKAVIGEILKATKKAHCVFYITRNPQPPQKGDSPNGESKDTQPKGTIEKIKEHLGAQTEVYSIFNKSIKTPSALSDSIIQQSDENGLNDLDSKMRDELGEGYIGRKTLSALVAFCALGEKMPNVELLDDSDLAQRVKGFARTRDKFINAYSKDELLKKSLFLDFANFISNDLAQNIGEKIKKSNFKKAHQILLGLSDTLDNLHKIYGELYEKCYKEVSDSCSNIRSIVYNAKEVAFKSACDAVVDKFISKIREEIYNYINQNVKDSEFEARFKKIIEYEQGALKYKFQIAFEKVEKDIQSDIERELVNFERRIGNIAQEFQSLSIKNSFDSNLNINIDSGIDKWGLVSVGAGVAGVLVTMTVANLWNPAGWAAASALVITALVASVASLVLGAYKSVRKAFSDDYKKSQQRKAVDENLRKISNEIKGKTYESISKHIDENIAPNRGKIVKALQDSVDNIKRASEYFRALRDNEVEPLANQIKNEGGV
ncbi:GTPase [Helicobacter macacae]|uniref:G domain-containing protein n=1 Tax=Helicobacter macacae MIT 99-5501 TaxID=1357400 RepID=V8C929_9HELI|nr:GTPase [Helicobacter macacae]ETD23495.1 hypothetical protein HMPREF2086_01300 [Helicobacter macacae MIT 99-5501]